MSSFLEMPNYGVISKSYLPSTGFKPITQMSRQQRASLGRSLKLKRDARKYVDTYGARVTGYAKHTRSGKKVVTSATVGGPPGRPPPGVKSEVLRRIKGKGHNLARGSGGNVTEVVGTSSRPPVRVLNVKQGAPMGHTGSLHRQSRSSLVRQTKVSKTFIPGRGYVSATKLPKSQLRMTVHTQRAAKARVRDEEARHFQAYRAADKAHKDLVADVGRKGTELPSPMKGTAFLQPNWAKEAQMKSVNIEAFAIKRGGRKNGQAVMVVPKGATKDTVNHEMAHLTPKRSGYRLHQVLNDPKKLMREEGRAEMATRSRGAYYKTDGPSTSGYIDMARDDNVRALANFQDKSNRGDVFGQGKYTKETLEEFKGVQDKIFEARRARGRDTFVIGGDQKFRGNQYVDDKKRRKVRAGLVALGGGTAAGGGGYSAYRWNKKRSTK